jgi:hypothetical protein
MAKKLYLQLLEATPETEAALYAEFPMDAPLTPRKVEKALKSILASLPKTKELRRDKWNSRKTVKVCHSYALVTIQDQAANTIGRYEFGTKVAA